MIEIDGPDSAANGVGWRAAASQGDRLAIADRNAYTGHAPTGAGWSQLALSPASTCAIAERKIRIFT
jgi:hypothetical protein